MRTVDRVPRRRRGTPPGRMTRHYVEVFDTLLRCCLYLTWGPTARPAAASAHSPCSGALSRGRRRAHTTELRRLPAAVLESPRPPTSPMAWHCCRNTGRVCELLAWPARCRTPYAAPAKRLCAAAGAITLTRGGESPGQHGHHGSSRPRARTVLAGIDGGTDTALDVTVGRAALRHGRRARRRHDLALPLRQVRLDHPFLGAARVAAVARRQPPVHFGLLVVIVVTCRTDHPEELDRRRSGSARGLHLQALLLGGIAGFCTLAGVGTWCTDGATPARCSWPPPARQADVRRARRRDRRRAGHHPARLPRAARSTTTGSRSPRGSGHCSCCSPTSPR